MRRSSSSRRGAAAALAVLLLGLTGCGSGDPDATTDDPAAASSSDAGQSTDPGEGDQSGKGNSGDDGDGAEPAGDAAAVRKDFLARVRNGTKQATTTRVAMSMKAAGGGFTAKGQIDYTTSPVSMSMTMKMPALGSQPIQMRLVDSTMYMNMGALSGAKFVALDLNDPNGPLGNTKALRDSMDPLKAVQDLGKGLESVRLIGQDEIDGTTTDHYRVVVDTKAMAADLEQNGMPAADLPRKLTYDMWMDENDHTLKTTMKIPGVSNLTMTTSDWGAPVSITKPPAGQVTDFESLGAGAA